MGKGFDQDVFDPTAWYQQNSEGYGDNSQTSGRISDEYGDGSTHTGVINDGYGEIVLVDASTLGSENPIIVTPKDSVRVQSLGHLGLGLVNKNLLKGRDDQL